MKTKHTLLVISLVVIAIIAFISFGSRTSLDLVAKVAVTSFDEFVKALPGNVSYDNERGGWAIKGMDGKDRMILSKDFNSNNPDLALEIEAEPFLKAGLDATKLPANQYIYDSSKGTITMPFELGDEQFGADAEESAMNALKQIVKTHRASIGYHQALDHYGITLGDGNMFEWAKDMRTNDKDMVFVMNPQPWIDAGVDPAKIQGWIFGKVPVMERGKKIEVEKLLKPFNVK